MHKLNLKTQALKVIEMNLESHSPSFGLFKPLDRDCVQETTLSFEATFYPLPMLKERHKIAWRRVLKLTKAKLLGACSEDRTRILIPDPKNPARSKEWPLCWAFNNQPTQTEWNRITPDSQFFLELRVSGLIPDGGERAVIVPLRLRYLGQKKESVRVF